jgi:hypothetical protein
MYSFFDLSGTAAARMMAGAGAAITTVILVAGHLAANPSTVSVDTAFLTIGALA